jgi:hypothetical protein
MKLKDLLTEGTLTPAAKKCLEVVINKFGRNSFPSIGTYNYRTIAGSKSLSQHAHGNAIDFHVPTSQGIATPEGKKLGNQVKDFLLQNSEELDIQLVIWYREDWDRRNNFKKSSYGGRHPHMDHVHVDFVRVDSGDSNNQININEKNNTYLVNLIGAYYKISSTKQGAEEYFGEFRSWNPLAPGIGDNEEGAADKLTLRFEKLYEPKLKRMENSASTSKEDKENIQYIRQIVTTLSNAILNGKSSKFDLIYNKYNKDTKQYERKMKSFNWNYM